MCEISVIVPCWNVATWLSACLDSVLGALPPESEVLAVDDGSTDQTPAILKARAARDGRLVVLSSAHRGVSAARNLALARARGRFLFFVDADDGVTPDYFRAMTGALEREGAALCVCAFAGEKLKGDYRFSSNAAIRAGYLPRVFGYSFADVCAWYRGRPLFAEREMASVCRVAFRRDFVEAHQLRFDETIELYEDAMFLSEGLVHAPSMTCLDRPLYRVTERPASAMRSIPLEARRLCRNKLALLAARERIDAVAGGALTALYEGSCVLSALEMVSALCRGRRLDREGFGLLRAYLARPVVRRSLRGFPLSFRRPLVALAVLFLRLI